MADRVAGKVAFITGAARGLGRAQAVRLAQEGADVIALDLCGGIAHRDHIPATTPADLEETVRLVEGYGRKVIAVRGDVRDMDSLTSAVRRGVSEFGHIDIVVANAGTIGAATVSREITEEDWQTTVDINLTGVWHTVKAVLPAMIEADRGGSIVLISSAAGMRAVGTLSDYGAVKAALIHLGRILALENGMYGIRVNAVAPGTVDTPLVANSHILSRMRPDLAQPGKDDVAEVLLSLKYLRGKAWIDPEDIANVVLWLASDESACVTATAIPVDMGEYGRL